MAATRSAWRPDATPLLTSAVYARNLPSQYSRLLTNRGWFAPVPLATDRTDPMLKARLSGKVLVWDGYEAFGSVIETRLGPTDERPRIKLGAPGTVTYETVPRGIDAEVPGLIVEENQTPIDLDVLAALQIRCIHQVQREQRIATLIEDEGGGSTWAGAGFAALGSTADVIGQLSALLDDVEDASPVGMRPPGMIVGAAVARRLRDHPQARGLEGTITAGLAAAAGAPKARDYRAVEAWLSGALGITVGVGDAYINTAKPGQAASLSRVWGADDIYLVYDVPESDMPVVTGGMSMDDVDASIVLSSPRSVLTVDATPLMSTGRWIRPDERVHFVYGDTRQGETLLGSNLAFHYSATSTGA